jgi:hypothetical protein
VISLDGSADCEAGSGSVSSTFSCTPGSAITAGDLITVQIADRNCLLSSVSDSVNGAYTPIFTNIADPANPSCANLWYKANAAAGTYPITLTLESSEAGAGVYISAQAWKASAATSALDTSWYQVSTSGTVANANCGSAPTLAGNGELVLSYAVFDNDTTSTGGTGFTQINPTGEYSITEYQIQTTATPTTGPFVSAADDWVTLCAAFKP